MSGLTADARTLVDHARVEAQALRVYDFSGCKNGCVADGQRLLWNAQSSVCLLLSRLFCFLCGLEVLICS